MSTYTTKQGDKWDAIALSQYGTISCVDKLMMANTKYIGVYMFPAGIVLDIPDIDTDTSADNSDLSPWKQVT